MLPLLLGAQVMTPAGFEFSCGKELKYWVPANTYIAVSHVAVSLDTSIFPQVHPSLELAQLSCTLPYPHHPSSLASVKIEIQPTFCIALAATPPAWKHG